MDIIFDTCSLHNDFFLTGTNINKLVIQAKSKHYNLYLPEVVLHEMIKHFERDCLSNFKQIEKGINDYERITGEDLAHPLTKKIVEDKIKSYPRKFKSILKTLGIVILSLPKNCSLELTKKAIKRLRPFKSNGEGLPDAGIWATILERAEIYSEVKAVDSPRIIFVSDNHRDFCKSADFDLHPDLEDDLINLDINPVVVKMISSIDEVIKTLTKTSDEIIREDYVSYISSETFKSSTLYKEISEQIVRFLPYKSFQPEELGLSEIFEDPSIDTFEEDFKFEFNSLTVLSEKEISVSWTLSVTCWLDFYIERSNLLGLEENEISVYDWNWNRHYVAAQKEKDIWFTIEIITDEKLDRLKNFEIEINQDKNEVETFAFRSSDL